MSVHRANKWSYGWPQLGFKFTPTVSAQSKIKAFKTCLSISCSQVPPLSTIMSPCNHSCVCLTHWAIHHRWQRLLSNLAAMLLREEKTFKSGQNGPWQTFQCKTSLGNPVHYAVIELHIYFKALGKMGKKRQGDPLIWWWGKHWGLFHHDMNSMYPI